MKFFLCQLRDHTTTCRHSLGVVAKSLTRDNADEWLSTGDRVMGGGHFLTPVITIAEFLGDGCDYSPAIRNGGCWPRSSVRSRASSRAI